jgi:hypothetical protein
VYLNFYFYFFWMVMVVAVISSKHKSTTLRPNKALFSSTIIDIHTHPLFYPSVAVDL